MFSLFIGMQQQTSIAIAAPLGNSSMVMWDSMPSTSDAPWREGINGQQDEKELLQRINAFELNQLMESERVKLLRNEEIRAEIWSKFMPFLVFALLFYIILSILWLVYNYKAYKKQKMKSMEFAKVTWNSRLLKVYEEMPMDLQPSSSVATNTILNNPETNNVGRTSNQEIVANIIPKSCASQK